jgi:hypothetical protein
MLNGVNGALVKETLYSKKYIEICVVNVYKI